MQRRRVQRTSLLCPKSHYSLEHLITGPLRNINTFYFRHRLTVFFKFSSIFVSSVASFWSIKKKKIRDFQSAFTSMVDAFPSCKYVQSATEQGQKHRYNPEEFCCTAPDIPFRLELVRTTAKLLFSTLLLGSFTHC